jgi:hypothetical protein
MIKHCVYCSKSDPIEATLDKEPEVVSWDNVCRLRVTEKSKDCCGIGRQTHIRSLGSVMAFMALKQGQ